MIQNEFLSVFFFHTFTELYYKMFSIMYTGISEKKLVTLLGGLWVLVIDCRNWCYVILFHDIEGSRVVTILLAEYDCHAEFRNGQREFPDFQDSKVAV